MFGDCDGGSDEVIFRFCTYSLNRNRFVEPWSSMSNVKGEKR